LKIHMEELGDQCKIVFARLLDSGDDIGYTAALYVMVTRVKGGGCAVHPPPTSAWADFTIMIECTPEIDICHSVSTL